MEIQYVIINFLILAGILVLFCRKMVVGIFRTRRENILRALDEAEQIENSEMPMSLCEPESGDVPMPESPEIEKERALAKAKIDQIRSFGEHECVEIQRYMDEKARETFFQLVQRQVQEIFRKEPYRGRMREKEAAQLEAILGMLRLTPGDLAYIRRGKPLQVTLTATHPSKSAEAERIRDAASKMIDRAGGRISFQVREDPGAIAGVCLCVGDTVYDGTVREELYHFEKSIEKEPLMTDDAVQEILAEFREKAESFEPKIHVYQCGRVIQISDGICWIDGLSDIMYGEVIEFDCGERGMVLDIQPERVGCVVFGKYEKIESENKVRRVGRIASVPVGEALLGRVVDAVGNPIDGNRYLATTEKRPIECPSPHILDRAAVNEPLHTGIKAVDALVPIGKGQRELIIGDRQTGKTAIALDAIINQKGRGTVCIYVAVGQKESTLAEIKDRLEQYGAMEYTVIVAAGASSSAATQYIAPFSGTAMAEYFMYAGRDVLIVYDDLSKHAVAYRELSLLLHRPSGREAYPGDIFYLHSRLLERSAHLSQALGGGSITALPIIETLAGDISAYIPTNVISITDGQIFLESELFHEGQRPAVNVGLSVSRVGGAAQTGLMKQMSASLRTKLAQYRELADFMHLSSDIDEDTKRTLDSGAHLMEALKQGRYQPLEDWKQALLLFAVLEGHADQVPLEEMYAFEQGLFLFFETCCPSLTAALKTGAKADAALLNDVRAALGEYSKRT